jgi:hypothetical protein
MKKNIVMALCCAVFFAACASGPVETITVEGTDIPVNRERDFKIDNSSEYLVFIKDYRGSSKVVGIPDFIRTDKDGANKPVYISFDAFAEKGLTAVGIPGTVKNISKGAFYGNELTSVVIPEGVEEIGAGAFAHNKLTNIVLPNSLRKIGAGAFANNKLTSVTIPDGVTDLNIDAFDGNNLAGPPVIPESVKKITSGKYNEERRFEEGGFYNCEVTGTGTSRSLVFNMGRRYNVNLIIPDAVYGIPVTVLNFESKSSWSDIEDQLSIDEIVLPAGLTEIRDNTEPNTFLVRADKVTAPNDRVQALWDEFTVKQREKKIAWDAGAEQRKQARENAEAEERRRSAEATQQMLNRMLGR